MLWIATHRQTGQTAVKPVSHKSNEEWTAAAAAWHAAAANENALKVNMSKLDAFVETVYLAEEQGI